MPSLATQRRALVLTALPVEYSAVRAYLANLGEEEHAAGDVYERGQFTAGAQTWEVGIVEMGAGNPNAALKTERAIDFFKPEVVLFVGVAGGLKDVKVGDVVVATKVYGYHSGKAEAEFKTRPEVRLPHHRILERARAEARKDDWLTRLEPPAAEPKPVVFLGAIAAGEQVVVSEVSNSYQLIRRSYGDALAVEMESYGFFTAVQAHSGLEALAVRGISDLLENKAEADAGGSQPLASRHAAAFAFELLTKLNLPPSRSGFATSTGTFAGRANSQNASDGVADPSTLQKLPPKSSGMYCGDASEASTLLENLISKYCVAEVAVVAVGSGFRPADSPLKSQYLGKTDIIVELQGVINDTKGRPATIRYRLTLAELGSFSVECRAQVIDSFNTHIEIWPKLKMAGLKLYFLGSACANHRVVMDYGFSVFDDNGVRIGKSGRSFLHNHEIHGVPEFLVVEIPKKNCEAGVFRFSLTDISHGGEKYFNLAIYLGVLNSCIYATTTHGKCIPLDFSAPAERLGKAVFNNPAAKNEYLVQSVCFLPCYSSVQQESETSVLPTELRLIGNPKRSDLGSGVKSFVILPMRFKPGPLEPHFRGYPTRGYPTLSGFKWPGGLIGTDFEHEESRLTREYLRQMLLMAATILRSMGYSRLNMLRATYPEAFSYPQRRQYADMVAETMQTVLSETGIAYQDGPLESEQLLELAKPRMPCIRRDTSGMVSESIAALLSASSSDYNVFAERGICIVLNIGDGTTDVAAYVMFGGGKRDTEQSIGSITDSIRYSGHDLLRLLSIPEVINDILKSTQWRESMNNHNRSEEDICLEAMKILMCDPIYLHSLKANFNSPAYLPELKERILLFFDGLFEYTRLLTLAYQKALQADGQKWVVNIALLGDAWKLAELVYPSRELAFDTVQYHFKNYLASSLEPNQKIYIDNEVLSNGSSNEAIAMGALKFNALEHQFSTPKEHASLAGLEVVCHDADGQDAIVRPDEFLTGFDRAVFDRTQPLTIKSLGNLREQPFLETLRTRYFNKDDTWITNQIGWIINQSIREQWIVPGNREPMKFSPMRLFLEHVWKETIRVVPLVPLVKKPNSLGK